MQYERSFETNKQFHDYLNRHCRSCIRIYMNDDTMFLINAYDIDDAINTLEQTDNINFNNIAMYTFC